MEKLVLEYAKAIDFCRQNRFIAQMEELQHVDMQMILDDCLSQGSVIFPARRLHPNACKLDMSIVSGAQHDRKVPVLVRSLAYCCQLGDNRYVTEGVDSLAGFMQLKSLSTDRFQSCLFSPPMWREHLPDLIYRFSRQHDPANR